MCVCHRKFANDSAFFPPLIFKPVTSSVDSVNKTFPDRHELVRYVGSQRKIAPLGLCWINKANLWLLRYTEKKCCAYIPPRIEETKEMNIKQQ